MKLELTPEQRAFRDEVRAFAQAAIAPQADGWDRDEAVPLELVRDLAARGYLGLHLPREHGGGGRDFVSYGLATEEIGKACSSVRSLLTVHDMAGTAVLRWGSREQKARWLPALARGEVLGAFALSEPGAGSDAAAIITEAVPEGEGEGAGFRLSGCKRWITFGQIAHLYLTFAQCEGKPTAFLVERDTPGFSVTPIRGMMGTRASMLAQLDFDGCFLPRESLLGRIGFGISHVMGAALDHGRYSVAWGSVGIAQASLDAARAHASERVQGGKKLAEHQLIAAMLADMMAGTRAARLLCCRAGYLKDQGDPGAFLETWVAKYFATTVATRAADAVQIHGAKGLSDETPVGRYFRDSRVMEIIEGSTQIQQITIPRFELQEF